LRESRRMASDGSNREAHEAGSGRAELPYRLRQQAAGRPVQARMTKAWSRARYSSTWQHGAARPSAQSTPAAYAYRTGAGVLANGIPVGASGAQGEARFHLPGEEFLVGAVEAVPLAPPGLEHAVGAPALVAERDRHGALPPAGSARARRHPPRGQRADRARRREPARLRRERSRQVEARLALRPARPDRNAVGEHARPGAVGIGAARCWNTAPATMPSSSGPAPACRRPSSGPTSRPGRRRRLVGGREVGPDEGRRQAGAGPDDEGMVAGAEAAGRSFRTGCGSRR
jgi:hypothetical protein